MCRAYYSEGVSPCFWQIPDGSRTNSNQGKFYNRIFILALLMDELTISKTSTVKHDRIVPGEKFSVDSVICTVSCAILSALGRPTTY